MHRQFYPILLAFLFCVYNGAAQTYTGTQNGRFLRDWYLAGPVKITNDAAKPDVTAQQEFFNRKDNQAAHVSFKTPDDGKSFDLKGWTKVSSKSDIIDLDSIFNHIDMASAYAYAVIVSKEAR